MKKTLLAFILLMTFAQPTLAAVGIPSEYYPQGSATINGAKPTAAADAELKRSLKNDADEARLELTRRIVNTILGVAGILAVFFIVYSGFMMAIAAGEEDKITNAKKSLTWAVIGLILVLLSYSIIRFVISVPFQGDELSNDNVRPPAVEAQPLPPDNAGGRELDPNNQAA